MCIRGFGIKLWNWNVGGFYMDSLKFLGKPAPIMYHDARVRAAHLEGAIKEAVLLKQTKINEWPKETWALLHGGTAKDTVIFYLLRKTIGE